MKVRIEYKMTCSEWRSQTYRNVTEEWWRDIVTGLKQEQADGLIEDYKIGVYPEPKEEVAWMLRSKKTGELPATFAERE